MITAGTRSAQLTLVMAWMSLTALLAGVLWSTAGGFETTTFVGIVLLAAVVAAGFMSGAVCWTRGHHILGLIGLISPMAPVVGHLIALRCGPEESWAPTMVGDLLGMLVAILGSAVALLAALATRRKAGARRAPTGTPP